MRDTLLREPRRPSSTSLEGRWARSWRTTTFPRETWRTLNRAAQAARTRRDEIINEEKASALVAKGRHHRRQFDRGNASKGAW